MKINIDYDTWESFFSDAHVTFEVAEQNQAFSTYFTSQNSAIEYTFSGSKVAGNILVVSLGDTITVAKWRVKLNEELQIHRAGRNAEEQSLLFNFVKCRDVQLDVKDDADIDRKYFFNTEDLRGWSVMSPSLAIDSSFPAGSTLDMLNIRIGNKWFADHFDLEKNTWFSQLIENESFEKTGQMNAIISHYFDDIISHPTNKDTFLLQFQTSIHQLILSVNDVMNDYEVNPPYGINYNDVVEVGKVERIIMESLTKKLPGMKVLAQEANMSVTKFMRIFKKVYRDTPYEYYQKQRMTYARKLIYERKASVTEAGRIVGYKSLSHFSVAFKKEFGSLPSEL